MIFKTERGVRRWLKEAFQNVWWIEGKAGGTVGLPDAFVVQNGNVLFVELKLARLVRGQFRISMRPAQLVQIRRLIIAGAKVIIVAGIYDTNRIGILDCSNEGRINDAAGCWRIDGWDAMLQQEARGKAGEWTLLDPKFSIEDFAGLSRKESTFFFT